MFTSLPAPGSQRSGFFVCLMTGCRFFVSLALLTLVFLFVTFKRCLPYCRLLYAITLCYVFMFCVISGVFALQLNFYIISLYTYYFCSTLYSCVSFRNELLPISHLYITTMLCATIYPFIRNIILIAATSYTLSQCTLSGKDDMLYSLQLFNLPLQNIGYKRVYLFVWGYLMKFMVFHKYTKNNECMEVSS